MLLPPPDISIQRGGILLEPDPADEREAEGILNPAVAGDYLLYRAVAKGNFSRLMAAELIRTGDPENPIRAEKLGKVVMEPTTAYELTHEENRGGIEDPRVTQLDDGTYCMFYTGFGRASGFKRQAPLVAIATSRDGLRWLRQGRLVFASYQHQGEIIDFNVIPNKDMVLFSEKVNGRYALLHRPMFTRVQALRWKVPWRGIWYAEADNIFGPWEDHAQVLGPKYEWEHGGVGAGVPPIRMRDAWLHIYHGFTKKIKTKRRYSAGVFITSHADPKQVLYRSEHAILEPQLVQEQEGIVPHVVFPTAVWENDRQPSNLAIFWGAADTRIMWGTLHLPADVLAAVDDGKHAA